MARAGEELRAMPPMKSDECSVCKDEFGSQDTVLLNCGHYFHGECGQRWYGSQHPCLCPLCRAQFDIAHYFNGNGDEHQETEEWKRVKSDAEAAAAAADPLHDEEEEMPSHREPTRQARAPRGPASARAASRAPEAAQSSSAVPEARPDPAATTASAPRGEEEQARGSRKRSYEDDDESGEGPSLRRSGRLRQR